VNDQQQLALDLAKSLESTASNLQRVSEKTSSKLAAWAFLQWDLRARAVSKGLPHAHEMLYTREALEQASHYRIAQYHASLFPRDSLVADLTCGIGSDLLALAERGPARGYEVDSERLELAAWNLQINGHSADLRLEDSTVAEWNFEFAIADPARRIGGRRTLHPSSFTPNPAKIAERAHEKRLVLMKLSPMLHDSFLKNYAKRLEFVSFGGECREALAFMGTDVQPGRFAVHLESGSKLEAADLQTVESPASYLYEADPAVIRAHALGSFGVPGLGDSNGYLTSDEKIESVLLKSYRVLAHGRFDTKSLRLRLREMEIGTVVVKSRTTEIDVTNVSKQLKGAGRNGIVAFYPVGKSIRFAIVERI
jgi:hypothetical protein